MFLAVGDFDVIYFKDITAENNTLNVTLEFEFDSSISLNTSLGYYLQLEWTQINGNHSGVAIVSSCWPNASNDTRGQLERVGHTGMYRLSVPKHLVGDGRLMVNMTVNLACYWYQSDCRCSDWQVRGSSGFLEVSGK